MSTFTVCANEAQAALFLALTAVIWGDWYAPTVTIWSDYQLFKLWREKLKTRIWLPPMVFFAIVIVIMYGFLQAALYAALINIYGADTDPYWVPFAVIILFAIFLMFTKRWLAVYMIGGRTGYALFLLALAFASAFPVTFILGYYGHLQELYCLIPYWIFWPGALYLNCRTLYEEKRDPDFKSEIAREKWYRNTATYDLGDLQRASKGAMTSSSPPQQPMLYRTTMSDVTSQSSIVQ